MAAARPPRLESRIAAHPNTTDASARGGELAGRRQRLIDESSRGGDQRAIEGRRDGVAQREHRPAVAVVRAEAPDP